MKAVVADLDDDLAVGEIRPEEGGLYLHRGLFPEVHCVSAGETRWLAEGIPCLLTASGVGCYHGKE